MFNTILLVEDDTSHALLIQRVLKHHCLQILHGVSVAAAVKHVEASKQSIDLIITDLHLPDESARGTTSRMLELADGKPVIVLTSSTSLTDAIDALKAGAKDFIVKNFDNDFASVIRLALHRIEATQELERERMRLEKEMKAFRSAIENGTDALAVLSSEGVIRYATSAFRRFLSECSPSPEVDAVRPHGDAPIFDWFSDKISKHDVLIENIITNLDALVTGGVWRGEMNFRDDKQRAYELSLSCLSCNQVSDEKTERELVLWVRDISELKRRERTQREIISTTTHDLKGPLGAILLSAELIDSGSLAEEKKMQLVKRISSSAQGAINLVDEMLSARRIQEGSFILRPSMENIPEILNGIIEENSPIADSRRITLITGPMPANDWNVDRLGFTRVITNLLGNALKFTPPGGTVTVGADIAASSLKVWVSDTGAGIEPGEIANIFERYRRLERDSGIAGTGLGLFVVKSIVSAHAGSIEVISATGKGTTFTTYWPHESPVNERGELIALDFN